MNVAVTSDPEASEFAMTFMRALQKAGIGGNLIPLPICKELLGCGGVSSSGAEMLVIDPEGTRLTEMLWQEHQIGGSSVSVGRSMPKLWSVIPKHKNCLVIGESHWALSPGNGQPGEGSDENSGADPAPHRCFMLSSQLYYYKSFVVLFFKKERLLLRTFFLKRLQQPIDIIQFLAPPLPVSPPAA
jgi:hypothetical protein